MHNFLENAIKLLWKCYISHHNDNILVLNVLQLCGLHPTTMLKTPYHYPLYFLSHTLLKPLDLPLRFLHHSQFARFDTPTIWYFRIKFDTPKFFVSLCPCKEQHHYNHNPQHLLTLTAYASNATSPLLSFYLSTLPASLHAHLLFMHMIIWIFIPTSDISKNKNKL